MSIFQSIPIPRLKRSTFRLSHDVKLTANIGKIIPVLCQPVLPGDRWKISTDFLLRLNPLIAPVMHPIKVYFHAFFVPNRLVWSDWEDFITRGTDGTDKPLLPYTTPTDISAFMLKDYLGKESYTSDLVNDVVGCLPDYFGLPVELFSKNYISGSPDQGTPISLLPFKGYQLIYNEYYRDETLEDEIDIDLYNVSQGYVGYGDILRNLLTLRNRAWSKDYFTGSLPWPQRLEGDEVTLPIAGQADIIKNGTFASNVGDALISESNNPSVQIEVDGSGFLKAKNVTTKQNVGIDLNTLLSATQISKLKADLSSGNSVTINQLREALRLQMWLENNARGGSRYVEQLLSHFGVRSKDARLQRPEYLGGYSAPVQISEVLQTSQTDESSGNYLGHQGGHGFALNSGRTIKRYFDEHGYIFIMLSVRPSPSYMQGIAKDWTKQDNLDFYFPEFQHLGEQPVLERELFYSGNESDDTDVFGYVPRYAEYKYIPSRVCGDFRTTMDYYHLARKFDSAPKLNADFIKCDEKLDGMDRIFAAQTDTTSNKEYSHLWFDIAHNIKCSRLMSRYGIPKLI